VVISEIAVQLIITWLFNRSGGSVPVVMFFHLFSNTRIKNPTMAMTKPKST
jgi:membrane protease YdiL (CAAX protease family)